MTFFRPKAKNRGNKAINAIAVVQFGLAMTLFPSQSWPLTSGTTKGTSSSYLKADELSTTTPFSERPFPISRAYLMAKSPDAARNTTS